MAEIIAEIYLERCLSDQARNGIESATERGEQTDRPSAIPINAISHRVDDGSDYARLIVSVYQHNKT